MVLILYIWSVSKLFKNYIILRQTRLCHIFFLHVFQCNIHIQFEREKNQRVAIVDDGNQRLSAEIERQLVVKMLE